MANDRRLSRILHGLIHMSQYDGAATSQTMAKMFGTNPVVVRRMMAGLRENGIVISQKGHGGSWILAKKLNELTLLDIYQALGDSSLFSISIAKEQPTCLVEQAVNDALQESLKQAETLLLEKFSQINLADIAKNYENKVQTHDFNNLTNPPPGDLST